jgi:hypothetical protein
MRGAPLSASPTISQSWTALVGMTVSQAFGFRSAAELIAVPAGLSAV